jgi:hypothetical protein
MAFNHTLGLNRSCPLRLGSRAQRKEASLKIRYLTLPKTNSLRAEESAINFLLQAFHVTKLDMQLLREEAWNS